jgi:hypothetical protein
MPTSIRSRIMPILHVVIMLITIAILAVLAGISWLYVVGTFAVYLLIVGVLYR